MQDDSPDEKTLRTTTPRPAMRRTHKVTIFRNAGGVWELAPSEGSVKVEADLLDGFRVGNDVRLGRCIEGPSPGEKMSADDAMRAGFLLIPVVTPSGRGDGVAPESAPFTPRRPRPRQR
jgi:hypothetical protein